MTGHSSVLPVRLLSTSSPKRKSNVYNSTIFKLFNCTRNLKDSSVFPFARLACYAVGRLFLSIKMIIHEETVMLETPTGPMLTRIFKPRCATAAGGGEAAAAELKFGGKSKSRLGFY